jgi:hypothetical protein
MALGTAAIKTNHEHPQAQPPAPADNSKVTPFPTPAKRRRHRLTLADAEAIAALVAKRANEREACAVLGIPYSTWSHWKAKPHNAEQFAVVLDRINGEKIKSHLENIDGFSKKDWRASEAYLSLTMPSKFSSKAATVEIHNHAPKLTDAQKAKIEALLRASLQKEIASKPATKQIQDAEIVSSDESNPS